ncbi:unnamed protein product [Ceutorhynchus assimilis]|uniref:Uncharacterized protein n=1 Tax=Ceutorhynchus assimilis TaxID=467358 RepID=A0A9N9MYE7_9CUCU|nr:unnamed protein product [Ceutorhynchus assimilis]
MTQFTLGYREVIADQDLIEKWTEIPIFTGGAQSTLQDIKVTEKASGYSYADSNRYYTRNRFIYWRIDSDILELIEHSLDINLTGNKLRYKFIDSPILDGVSVKETEDHIFILVPTVCSVHKFTFPHPSKYHRQDELLDSHLKLAAPSIFCNAIHTGDDPTSYYVFNNPSTANDQLPNLAKSFYNPDTEEAVFILAYPSAELLLIKLNSQGRALCMELKGESLMPRFLSGITEKFRSKHKDGNQIISALIEVFEYEVYALTLARNGHLKFWSCRNGQCVAAIDMMPQGSDRLQNALLRKAEGNVESYSPIAIFMSFPSRGQFHILKPIINNEQITIEVVRVIESVEKMVLDFSLQSNQIWLACVTGNTQCSVYMRPMEGGGTWRPVIKEAVHEKEALDGKSDPRQVYSQHLFHPGRFPLYTLNKSLGTLMKNEVKLTSVAALKQAICLAIENDIQNQFADIEDITDEEYLEKAKWCWEKFYSSCCQYYQISLKPLGLMLLPQNSAAILIRKATFSLVRPMEPLEHMFLCNDSGFKDQFINFALLGEEQDLLDNVKKLFDLIVFIESQMSKNLKTTFEREIGITLQPKLVVSSLCEILRKEHPSIRDQVNELKKVKDLYKAIHKLLDLLRHDSTPANPDNESNPQAMHYFSSALGISFVSTCLRQQCQNRFAICRNLLIICHSLNNVDAVTRDIRQACESDIIELTQANYVMLWLANLPAFNNVAQESALQRLNTIKLTPAFNVTRNIFSLLEAFISSTGGYEARKMLSKMDYHGEARAHWHLSLLPFISNLRTILWPLKTGTILPEWLVSSGQHLWLQQYTRLLSPWCVQNKYSCKFLLAASFLTCAENHKALKLFQAASDGILVEPFLQKLIKDAHEGQEKIFYYLKVIHLFELHKSRDCAIQMAVYALKAIEPESALVPTLYSIKFKHHLALRHYKWAFDDLKANPDLERRKDNLRDLVKTLLDEKEFDVLLGFTYGDMEELFTNILFTRARATDALNNVFYDILYSHQINRGSLYYRLAASIKYEQSFRLSRCNTVQALEKQVKCCLIAKNVLQLTDPEYAWVIRPSDPDEEETEIIMESLAGSGKDFEVFRIKKQVEVVTVDTMEKELVFLMAKLKLIKFHPEASSKITNIYESEELVMHLNNAGLFKEALQVCKTYKLSYASVFSDLTGRCVILSEDENSYPCDWLSENDFQDLSAYRNNYSTLAWELLQKLLKECEEPNLTVLHKVVTEKIISMRMYLPFWLKVSYKKRNSGELLRLLHLSGHLDEAFELCREYLLLALTSLSPNSQAFCMPVYEIQSLVYQLKLQNEKHFNRPFKNELKTLSELFQKYLTSAMRISNEKAQLQMSTFGTIPLNR